MGEKIPKMKETASLQYLDGDSHDYDCVNVFVCPYVEKCVGFLHVAWFIVCNGRNDWTRHGSAFCVVLSSDPPQRFLGCKPSLRLAAFHED